MASIYKRGRPHEVDVQMLKEAFPASTLTTGLVIEHEKLLEVLKEPKATPRYYLVVKKWRGELAKIGINLEWSLRQGVKVMSASALLEHVETKITQKARLLLRASRSLTQVDRNGLANDAEKRRFDYDLVITARLEQSLTEVRKEITLPPARSMQTLPMPAQLEEPEKKSVQSEETPAEKTEKAANEKE